MKILFCAPGGCKDPKNGGPGHFCVTHYINLFILSWEKHAHTGFTRFEIHAPGNKSAHRV